MSHQHEFAAIWSHFGRYGPQDVHLHFCQAIHCHRVVVGPGRDCDGDRSTHHEETLGIGQKGKQL